MGDNQVPDNVISISSDEEDVVPHGPTLYRRGPTVFGIDGTFDFACKWGNYIKMKMPQIETLRALVSLGNRLCPLYVCGMTKSAVIPRKAKMYFSVKFTKDHLSQQLDQPCYSVVYSNRSDIAHEVCLKMGKHDARAMISSCWTNVVEDFKIKKDEIWAFRFHTIEPQGVLVLQMTPL